MSIAALCKVALGLLGAVLPRDQHEWAAAIRAEIDIPDTAREKILLTLSGVFGLLHLALRGMLLRWSCYPKTLALVVTYGLAVGYVDTISSSRGPLRLLVLCGAAAFGMARPRVAALAGTLMGLSIVWVTRATGSIGPYARDPGDVWIPLLPAILFAVLGGASGKIWARLRSSRSSQRLMHHS